MNLKSDNMEFIVYDNADKVIEELFKSLLNRYQIRWETSMRGSDLSFVCVHLLYYKCHKIKPDRDESYINSPNWIKNKKATINTINKNDNKCFQYSVTVALNHEEIGKNSQRTSKLNLL